MTVIEALKDRYPEHIVWWDNWDYSVYGPRSLDDAASIYIILKREDGKCRGLEVSALDFSLLHFSEGDKR